MSEEESPRPERAPDSAAAMVLGAATRAKADAYLEKQNELADLQIEDLKRENSVRHWSLRVRHVSDVLKLGFELAIAFIVAAIAVGLGVVIWQAAHANGLVIESFDVPQEMAQKGLTGPVIANKLLDRLTVMQSQTDSSRAPASFAHDWTNDIKVEIPDTGISLGQIVRFLDDWLGDQMHLSGELYETSSGIVLTVRMDNDPGQTFEGKTDELGKVIAQAAEAVYARAQPYRYSVFLDDQSRFEDSINAMHGLAASGPRNEAAWAYLGIALLDSNKGDVARARADALEGLKANPDLPNLHAALAGIENTEGHDETELRELKKTLALTLANPRDVNPAAVEPLVRLNEANQSDRLGDYRDALAKFGAAAGAGGGEPVASNRAHFAVAMHDIALARRFVTELELMPPDPNPLNSASLDAPAALASLLLSQGDWRGAIAHLNEAGDASRKIETATHGWIAAMPYLRISVLPQLAYAHAMLGEFDQAEAIFKTLPQDCDICMRYRAEAEAARYNWSAADHDFAVVSARSPDIPFADSEWGEMLLRKGDLDSAIAKFESAHKKGPHFADPLEMWGEALILKNRSDLALAIFEEANKYAPNWGRLHLKWGEALWWAGKHDDAKKQFAIAAGLDMTPFEKSELAKVSHGG